MAELVMVGGWKIQPRTVQTMSNCRLKATRDRLAEALATVEEEIDGRLGKGGGGLK